ncbi:hypothetical protein [Agrobacterium vitis]|uniref:Uncharacterized protein n=1 Tax=Agrobacterium vitis TaxID=373 RepID=A0AAE2RHA0_AGRVI|nr:hypothetical protein [Agrobacterium vitis]MBF2717657.1 hypothetical protein [Agrobacterium vitis]MVA18316.1 hypothetical protein [Agrobacterium vitis]
MTGEEIRRKLNQQILSNFDVDASTVDASLPFTEIEGLNYDSLRALEFVEMVEAAFEVQVDLYTDDVQVNFSSFKELVPFCERKIADASTLLGL